MLGETQQSQKRTARHGDETPAKLVEVQTDKANRKERNGGPVRRQLTRQGIWASVPIHNILRFIPLQMGRAKFLFYREQSPSVAAFVSPSTVIGIVTPSISDKETETQRWETGFQLVSAGLVLLRARVYLSRARSGQEKGTVSRCLLRKPPFQYGKEKLQKRGGGGRSLYTEGSAESGVLLQTPHFGALVRTRHRPSSLAEPTL